MIVSPAPMALTMVLAAAEAAVLTYAAAHDVAARTIPNAASLLLACLGLMQRAARHQLLCGAAAAALVLFAGALLWRRGWLGGGDAKLLAACACLVAPAAVPALLAAVMISGGMLAILYGAAMRCSGRHRFTARPVALVPRILRLERWRVRRRAALPYGVAISAGALLHLFGG